MSGFPRGGDISITRAWLDSKGFTNVFVGRDANMIIGLDKAELLKEFCDNRLGDVEGLQLWSILTEKKQAGRPLNGISDYMFTEINLLAPFCVFLIVLNNFCNTTLSKIWTTRLVETVLLPLDILAAGSKVVVAIFMLRSLVKYF